jgi:hypothetical protein
MMVGKEMKLFDSQRFPIHSRLFFACLTFLLLILSPKSWAVQDAIVIADRAPVYADRELKSPIGYIIRGKQIRVGEVLKGRALIYPLKVSGKIAYIRGRDLTTSRDQDSQTASVAERFMESTELKQDTNYSIAFVNYASTITIGKGNGGYQDKDAVNWMGAQIKGEVLFARRWEFEVLSGYYATSADDEKFRMIDIGVGLGYRLVNWGRFVLKLDVQALGVPFAQYTKGSLFTLNGYGYTGGSSLSATWRLGESWGLEGFGGFYYTKLTGFDAPKNYESISPTFVGSRIGIGLIYRY